MCGQKDLFACCEEDCTTVKKNRKQRGTIREESRKSENSQKCVKQRPELEFFEQGTVIKSPSNKVHHSLW